MNNDTDLLIYEFKKQKTKIDNSASMGNFGGNFRLLDFGGGALAVVAWDPMRLCPVVSSCLGKFNL